MRTGRIAPPEWTNRAPISGDERVPADSAAANFSNLPGRWPRRVLTALVAERQPVVREGLRSWLRADDFDVVAEVDAGEAVAEAERLLPVIAIRAARAAGSAVRVRACVLVAAVAFGVLAVPATARSDPGSAATEQLLQQAGAAVNAAQALASQEVTATSSAAAAAMADTPASVPKSVARVENEATKTVSEVLATAGTASTSSPAGSRHAATRSPARLPAPHRRRHRAAARARPGAAPSGSARWSEQGLGSTGSARAIAAPPVAPGRAGGPAERHRSAGAVPHRLPPVPVPPQGLGGTAEGSGSATPAPLLVAALAAALFVIFFESLSRLLPRSAFRKPRRLALPPWHPG